MIDLVGSRYSAMVARASNSAGISPPAFIWRGVPANVHRATG
jgi:hypothetical protein